MSDEENRRSLNWQRERRRREWIARFAKRQHIAKRWIEFVNLAEWCAESATTAGVDEEKRARDLAFQRLAGSILTGEFEGEGRSQILYLDPRVYGDGVSVRCRLTREQFELAAMPPAASLPLMVLGRCWLPCELARRWLESHGYRWSPHFEPAPKKPATRGSGGTDAMLDVAQRREDGGRKIAELLAAHAGEIDTTSMPMGRPSKARPGPLSTAGGIQTAAKALLAASRVPAQTITWKQFRTELCRNLNVKPEQRGYSLATIQAAVRPLLPGAQVTESTGRTEN